MLEELVGNLAGCGGDGFHVEDKFSVGEHWFADEGAVEVVVAGFDIEGFAHEFGEVTGGAELIVKDSFEVAGSDFFEVKLATEALEDVEVCDGEIEVPGGERDLGGAFVAHFVIEVAEAVDEGVDVGFLAFEACDGSGAGFGLGEGFVGVGLFFDAVSGGGDQDEHDYGHHDEDEAAGEG